MKYIRVLLAALVAMRGVKCAEEIEHQHHDNDAGRAVHSTTACSQFSDCASCTMSKYSFWGSVCMWCQDSSACLPASSVPTPRQEDVDGIHYENDCPLGPFPYPGPPDLLPDWMGHFHQAGAFANVSLIDLSLPGTHDSLTYDLSLTVSEDGLQKFHELQELLHKISGGTVKILPGYLEDFWRMMAKTQQLNVTQQLDNGIRFFDLRIMRESDQSSSSNSSWYSLHFMQSKQVVSQYLTEIRVWMDVHPSEIVVVFLSQHGNPTAEGEDQFPDVTMEQKAFFWNSFLRTFQGLLLDTRKCSIFTSSVDELIESNCRLVAFAADYMELTNTSPYAYNARRIQNVYDAGDGVFDAEATLRKHDAYFRQSKDNNAELRQKGHFSLLGMNTAVSSWQVLHTAENLFLHFSPSACSSKIKIPGVTKWCPESLLDVAQLASYYNQIALEGALNNGWDFPNAFYLDALDVDGTIRTGSQLLDGAVRTPGGCQTCKYAYVGTVLEYNLNKSCKFACKDLRDLIVSQRSRNPLARWDDASHGRHSDWPVKDSTTQVENA